MWNKIYCYRISQNFPHLLIDKNSCREGKEWYWGSPSWQIFIKFGQLYNMLNRDTRGVFLKCGDYTKLITLRRLMWSIPSRFGMRLPESRSFCSKLENVLLSGPSSISVCYISLMIHDSEECIRRYSHNIDIQWSGEHFYGILLHPSWL